MFTETLTTPGVGGSWNFSYLDQSHKKKETGESGLESGWSTRIHAPTKRACLQTETWKRQDTRPYNTYSAGGIEGMDRKNLEGTLILAITLS